MLALLFSFLLFLLGCAPNSLEDYQQEGEARCRKLIRILEEIQTREDLVRVEGELKKEFTKIVDLMIQAKSFQQENPEEKEREQAGRQVSEELKVEMARIYRIEGAREIIERAQREPMLRLDAFERQLPKKLH